MSWYDKVNLMRVFLPALLLPALLCIAMPWPAAAQVTQFAVFGDSITFGHGDNGSHCDLNPVAGGYPPRLRQHLEARGLDSTMRYEAVCGERTDAGLTRIDSVLNRGGDVIIIMEGTNDVSEAVSFESTLFNLNAMMKKAELAGFEPVLASLVPRGPEAPRDSHNGKTRTIAMRLKEDAMENDWAFADQFHVLIDEPDFFELYYADQLHPNAQGYGIIAQEFIAPALDAATRNDLCAQVPQGPCVASDTVLCLSGGRFRLEAVWENFEGNGGVGHSVPQTDDTGAFWWFDPDNIELAVKVLDGRWSNGYFWVFYGALSNLKFSLLVTDTQTGECLEYFNPLGTFASVGDTTAFQESP